MVEFVEVRNDSIVIETQKQWIGERQEEKESDNV
jgi:hypothetical protein